MHVLDLCLTTIGSFILYGQRLSTPGIGSIVNTDDLATVLRCKDTLTMRFDVYAMVNLGLALVDGILTFSIWRGDKKKLLTLDRHTILSLRQVHASVLRLYLFLRGARGQGIGGNTKLLFLAFHLIHDHLVIFLQPTSLDDTHDRRDISLGRGIASLLDATCPSLVIVWCQVRSEHL